MPFYKSSEKEVLAAWAAYAEQNTEVVAEAKAFADHFNATPVYRHDLFGQSFFGLKFSPALTSPLWTKPGDGDTQRPRAALPRDVSRTSTPEAKKRLNASLKELDAKYNENLPKAKASLEPLWESIGTDWGNLLLCGVGFFATVEAVYVSTSARLNDRMTEILASEYATAKEAALS
ncbi:hypothetical protein [Pseudomonas fluorescens]|uniref:hypothetical protein n=1 Tax=Pseudomonas fluorescens TaxID=294 RepID=UPI00054B85C4|nr:hypothetical protein [Pseudomonas fluorescens]KII38382.1 hypothetical protein RY26_02575 [Pseudomonas fluorescens]